MQSIAEIWVSIVMEIVRAETEAQAMQQVADHARDVHGLQSVSEEVVEKVRQVMREE
jgi:predicted small metal-binding protein